MPENQIPAAQPEPGAAPDEFDFGKPTARIKKRTLKPKTGVTNKASNGAHPAAVEPESATAPIAAEPAAKPQRKEKATPTAKTAETPLAPPRTLPTTSSQAASASSATSSSQSKPAAAAASNGSPHGTRPATLYYSSYPRKEGTTTPMKTVPSASPSSSSSASTTAASTVRPASAATTSSRPAGSVDYRANVERQSREQKSVGSILSYVVYGLITIFVVGALLAGYGTKVIFDRLHDQSATVTDLDSRYSAANKDLNAKLATTQDTLTQAQAQITRQQELIMKQQEDLNKLIAATTDNVTALKQEKQARAQETATLRARVRDLEDRVPQKL